MCFACGAQLELALQALAEGAFFASRYEILGPLGHGGMGVVYRAFDRELGETVAIKVLRPDMARESGRVEQRFRSEIRLARRVRHRNVCSVYGDGEDRGLHYICMELVEGENLAPAARDAGGLRPDEAWSAALQVTEGLAAIHEAGVVHRDLKTANLMRDRKGVVRVMDFGIAKQHGSAGGVTVTATGSLMGTPEYMSPEQLRGEDVDFRGDLYSLGVVIFELFTGALPFRGETPVATIVRQLHDAPFLELPLLPAPLRPVLARALAKDPADRYATAAETYLALQAAYARSAPGISPVVGPSTGEQGPADETWPIVPVSERPPIARMAVAHAALAVLVVHLVSAGGVAPPPAPPALPTPSPAPKTIVTIEVAAPRPGPRAATSRGSVAPRATLPKAPLELPTRPLRELQQPPATKDPKIYGEDDVDVPPRLVSSSIASYPAWGPKLTRGARVSITASFVVNEAGNVTDIRVEQGRGVLEAVLVEMSRWRYEPGRKNGRPVKVRVSVKHTFVGG